MGEAKDHKKHLSKYFFPELQYVENSISRRNDIKGELQIIHEINACEKYGQFVNMVKLITIQYMQSATKNY